MNTTSTQVSRPRVASSGGGLVTALFVSAALWPLTVVIFWGRFESWENLQFVMQFGGLPLLWLMGPAYMLKRARCPTHALAMLALLPLAALMNFLMANLVDGGFIEYALLRGEQREHSHLLEVLLPALLGGAWSIRYCVRLAARLREHDLQDLHLGRALGLLAMFATVCAASVGWILFSIEEDRRLQIRIRVSELVLATSSAKTALSEGMQTFGTWSPTWMSAITISATGMIKSASIGPTGVITVTGIAGTSNAIVTMTPTITTDNKLMWSCTGTPAKYMPASCR